MQLSEGKFLYAFYSISKHKKEEIFPFIVIVFFFFFFIKECESFLCSKLVFLYLKPKKPPEEKKKVSLCRLRIRSTVCCMQEFSWLFSPFFHVELLLLPLFAARLCMLNKWKFMQKFLFILSSLHFPLVFFVTLLCNIKSYGD